MGGLDRRGWCNSCSCSANTVVSQVLCLLHAVTPPHPPPKTNWFSAQPVMKSEELVFNTAEPPSHPQHLQEVLKISLKWIFAKQARVVRENTLYMLISPFLPISIANSTVPFTDFYQFIPAHISGHSASCSPSSYFWTLLPSILFVMIAHLNMFTPLP